MTDQPLNAPFCLLAKCPQHGSQHALRRNHASLCVGAFRRVRPARRVHVLGLPGRFGESPCRPREACLGPSDVCLYFWMKREENILKMLNAHDHFLLSCAQSYLVTLFKNVHYVLIILMFLALRLPAEVFERLYFRDELKMTVPSFALLDIASRYPTLWTEQVKSRQNKTNKHSGTRAGPWALSPRGGVWTCGTCVLGYGVSTEPQSSDFGVFITCSTVSARFLRRCLANNSLR